MDLDKIEKISEAGKNTSEAAKNFCEVISAILQPRGIKAAINNAHIKIIDSYIDDPELSKEDKTKIISSYRRKIKEYDRCAKVVEIASDLISEEAKSENVEEDWFNFFFDKVRLISDESVQNMWAQILAEEVNKPGTISRALVHTLSIMNSAQAKLFCNLAKFCMYEYKNEQKVHPFIFIASNVVTYEQAGITSSGLVELENLGLIQCDFKDEFVFWKRMVFGYGNDIFEVVGDPKNDNKINAGNIQFTSNGLALFNIVGDSYKCNPPEIRDFILAKFQLRNCTVKIKDECVM